MHRCVPVQGMKMPHPKDLAQTKISALRLPKGMKDWQFVVRQRLANPRILGEIPPPFGQMLELFVMDLAHNNLQGRIPAELGQLQKWRGCSKTKQKPMSWPVHFCMSCAVVAVQVRVYAQWFWLYSWIDCFATNFKFRGGPIVHTNGKTWVEGEKAVLALVCPGYSESVSLSDCWFQFNSSPTWLLCFGDAAAKQELHDTRDIGIPVLTSILVKASDAEPCLINAWEIKLMHWPNDRALSLSAQVGNIGPLRQSAERGHSPRNRATCALAELGAELQQVEWRNSSAIQTTGSSGFSPKIWQSRQNIIKFKQAGVIIVTWWWWGGGGVQKRQRGRQPLPTPENDDIQCCSWGDVHEPAPCTPTNFCTRGLLHQKTLAQETVYTKNIYITKDDWNQRAFTLKTFTPKTLFTRWLLQHNASAPHVFYTKELILCSYCQTASTPDHFCNGICLHQQPCTPKNFYTRKPWTQGTLYAKELLQEKAATAEPLCTSKPFLQTRKYPDYKIQITILHRQ